MIAKIIAILLAILDRLPSRKESIYNEIERTKKEIYDMQKRPDHKWNAVDSGNYYILTERLRQLEARAKNAGF
jgi:hypothetical protein